MGLGENRTQLTAHTKVYFFVGCILAGTKFVNYIPAAIVAFIGLAYIALEFVPSIEPPANMRYVPLVVIYEDEGRMDTDRSQGRGRRLGRRAGVSKHCIYRHIAAVKARWKTNAATTRWYAEMSTSGVEGHASWRKALFVSRT